MNFYELLLSQLIGTGVVIGAATWFLKQYIARHLDNIFMRRERILEAKIRLAEKQQEQILGVMNRVLPEIQSLVYQSRNLLRKIYESRDATLFDELFEHWSRLNEYLIKYQLILPEGSFDKIHEFKNRLQSVTLMLGAAVGSWKDQESSFGVIDKNTRVADREIDILKEHFPMIEELYQSILTDLRLAMKRQSEGF